jgi:hypothetical protein
MNIALNRAPNEELQQVFLNAIDQLSVSHVRVLDFVWKGFPRNNNPWKANDFPTSPRDYGAAIRIALPEFAGDDNLLQYILTDLRNRGFSNLSGPNAPYPQGMPATITNMGIGFLEFIRRSQ